MIGKKRLYRSRAYYWRKCKRVSGTNIDSVPDELLLEILVRLPADDLHHRARVVCRRWRHLIHSDNFIKTQLHRSTYGLFLSFSEHPSFVTAEQGRIETYNEVSCKVPTGSWLRSSCNGLVLHHCHDTTVSVTNPVTGLQFVSPSFPFTDNMISRGWCGIGYAADSMEYKVVQPYITVGHHVFLAILSVGSDKPWRHVGVEHLSINARQCLNYSQLVTEGFITCTRDDELSYLTLDVETEVLTFHPNPLPEACLVGTYSVYLSTGRSLSLVVAHRYAKYLMEVWEMNPESGEWRKVVGDIKLGAHELWLKQFPRSSYRSMYPLGWVRYPEILVLYFRGGSSCILFNLNTQQISSMEVSRHLYTKFSHPHKKSLTWFT